MHKSLVSDPGVATMMTGQLLAQQRRTFARSEIALSKANHHNSPQLLPMRNGTGYSSTQLTVSLHACR